MRYYYEKPDFYLSMYGEVYGNGWVISDGYNTSNNAVIIYICDHPETSNNVVIENEAT